MSSTERKSASGAGLAILANRKKESGGEANAEAAATPSVTQVPPVDPHPSPPAPPAEVPATEVRRTRNVARSRPHQVATRLSDAEKANLERVLMACRAQLDDNAVSKHEILGSLIDHYVRPENVDELCRLIESYRATSA